MRFKELSLENYKIFYGNNVLKFDSDKKIFVIQGLNGYGKSTLVEAILFALYGKAQGSIINDYAVQNNQNFCRVSLDLVHNGNNYKVEREIIDNIEKFKLKVNGASSNLKIENIIPESVARLSILDCEKFAYLINTELDFEDAWKIKELKKAKNDLERLKSKLELSLSRIEKMKLLMRRILGLDTNRVEARKLEKLVTQEGTKIKALNSKIDELERLVRAREFLEKEQKFKKNFPILILDNLLEEAVRAILKRKDEAIKARLKQGRLSAERELLEKILAEERCICGSKFSTSQFGKREIIKLINRLKEEELLANLPFEKYAQSAYELNLAVEKVRNLKINVEELRKEQEELSITIPKAINLSSRNLTKELEELKLERKARELKVIELEEEHKRLVEKIRKVKTLDRKNILLKIKKLE
ncbi:MAG: AAA family ATPase, partial [Candidatus Thermoplasmatota archaeon]